jgi:hypothetical protein
MITVSLATADDSVLRPGKRPQGGGQETWGDAWQKEMERAQAGSWFGHGVVDGMKDGVAAQARVRPVPLPLPPHADVPPGAAGAGQPRLAGPLGVGAQAPAAMVPAPMPPVLQTKQSSRSDVPVAIVQITPGAANVEAAADGGLCGSAHARGDVRRSGAPNVERQAVRLHVESAEAGVRVWLGMDAGTAVPAAQFLQQLRRSLGAAGYRLLSVTCNGHSVPLGPAGLSVGFLKANFSDEMEASRWPSAQ